VGRTHFDHIIPYSRGGLSLAAENIQLLCARSNLARHDNIEPSKDLCTLRYQPEAAVESPCVSVEAHMQVREPVTGHFGRPVASTADGCQTPFR
jgi:hypothetical protein